MSGLYGGCSRGSQPNSWIFCRVAFATWGLALSWMRRTPLRKFVENGGPWIECWTRCSYCWYNSSFIVAPFGRSSKWIMPLLHHQTQSKTLAACWIFRATCSPLSPGFSHWRSTHLLSRYTHFSSQVMIDESRIPASKRAKRSVVIATRCSFCCVVSMCGTSAHSLFTNPCWWRWFAIVCLSTLKWTPNWRVDELG